MTQLNNLKHEASVFPMGKGGNNMQQFATDSYGLTQQEVRAIQLRYEGKSSQQIATATGYNASHVRRLFMSNGRLEQPYRAYERQQQQSAQVEATTALERAKEEAESAIERMVTLSKTPDNGPVCYKANEYLLSLSGINADASIRSTLQKLSYDKAKERTNEIFIDVFGKPFHEEGQVQFNASGIDPKEALEIAKEIYRLSSQITHEICPHCKCDLRALSGRRIDE